MKRIVFGVLLMAFLPAAWADSGTVTIINGFSRSTNGPFTLGETGSGNFLLIDVGGRLTNTTGTIGMGLAAGQNLALVMRPGSVWHNRSNFILGATGSMNQFTISDSGRAGAIGETIVGLDAASMNNILTIDGPGSIYDVNLFTLGLSGASNTVIVNNGGRFNGSVSFDRTYRIGSNAVATDNLFSVSDAGSSATMDHVTLGYDGSRNVLEVFAGARFTNASMTIGRETNSTGNRATVSGAGSFWQFGSLSAGGLWVGMNGRGNTLTVGDGATLVSSAATLGEGPSASNNTAMVSGANALWAASGTTVGRRGDGNVLTVANGALNQSGPLVVGEQSSGNRVAVNNGTLHGGSGSIFLGSATNAVANELFITGAQALLTNRGSFVVGSNGSFNRLILSNGASVLTQPIFGDALMVGAAAGSRSNVLVVAGAGSRLISSAGLEIGGGGSDNRGTIADGAFAQTTAGSVGRVCAAANNRLTVTGPGTVWMNGGLLDIGFCSFGNGLLVSNQARVLHAGQLRSSVQGGGNNNVVVAGAGSLLSCGQGLTVGNVGPSNSLLVLDGARLEGRNDAVGVSGTGTRALVSGVGSIWTNFALSIGSSGLSNRLVLSNAAQIVSASATLGGIPGGPVSRYNEALVTGAGSSWSIRSNIVVGVSSPPHRFFITDGGRVSAQRTHLGLTGSANQPWDGYNQLLQVAGSNSLLALTDLLSIGSNGPLNRLEIRDGARVTNRFAVMGPGNGATNCSALVAGVGSLWTTDAELWVGGFGRDASLAVTNGGRVRCGVGVIDASRLSLPTPSECSEIDIAARAVVTGPGSVWECGTNLILGTFGKGNTLDIRNGGLVTTPAMILSSASVSLGINLCVASQGRNLLTLDGGCLVVTNPLLGGVLEIRNGVLFMQRGSVILDELRATNRFYGRFDLLGGSARLRRAYLGNVLPLVIGDGFRSAQLFVDSADGGVGLGSIDAPAGVLVNSHSTLAGGVIVNGSVTNAGTLRPGGYRGAYFGFPILNLGASSVLHFDIDGRLYTTNYHPISVGATLFLRGELRVSLRGGFVPAPADVFHVISYNQITNSFDNVIFGGRVKTTDGLGTFLVTANGFNVNLSDYQSTDLDGDRIEDAWANMHFGHSPLTLAERAADTDGDGASNADEFRAGTNPKNPASVLRAVIGFSAGQTVVTFPCVDGKDYRVLASDNLVGWRRMDEPSFTFPAPGYCSWMDDGKETGGLGVPTRFYRVEVE